MPTARELLALMRENIPAESDKTPPFHASLLVFPPGEQRERISAQGGTYREALDRLEALLMRGLMDSRADYGQLESGPQAHPFTFDTGHHALLR